MTDSPLASQALKGTGPQDLILVQSALTGDRAAVQEVLSRLSCVVKFIYRLNQSLGYGLQPEFLEDVTQQVYMAVWTRLDGFAGSAALESWVYGFCRNCLRAEARKRAQVLRTTRFSSDEVEMTEEVAASERPDELASQAEGSDAVRDELEQLKPAEREVVALRHLEGWSFEQIARQQGLPASTVKDRCYRALMKMKGRLKRRNVIV